MSFKNGDNIIYLKCIIPTSSFQIPASSFLISSETVMLIIMQMNGYIYSVHSKLNILSSNFQIFKFSNYPNPFSSTTNITYFLPQTSNVTIKITDVIGQEIKTLVNEVKDKGLYNVTFDASLSLSKRYIFLPYQCRFKFRNG